MNMGEMFVSSCIFGALVSIMIVLCRILNRMENRDARDKIRRTKKL